ncbi:imm11 family protein [Corallococcus sp. 4LFB]|uniref:imm11 family protein n=1 Tax=Corallococcus sp. 4LFB TaxID=3383249 RepID=UPI003975633D
MEARFYWVEMADVPQWLVSTPEPASGGAFEEPWMFADGRVLSPPGPIRAEISHPGQKRAFMFSVIEKAPIVSEAVANVFRSFAPDDVQLFPVSIEGEAEPYFVVNATRVVDCIDEARCREVHHYAEDDPFPEYAGEYRWIYGLRIDPAKTGGAQVLRPKKFKTAFIVSEEVKTALEAVGNLGVSFEPVTGPQEPLPRGS